MPFQQSPANVSEKVPVAMIPRHLCTWWPVDQVEDGLWFTDHVQQLDAVIHTVVSRGLSIGSKEWLR